MTDVLAQRFIQKIFEALKVAESERSTCSFAFSKTKPIPASWKCFTSDLAIPFWHIYAPSARQSEIRRLSSGISAENFMLLADLGEAAVLVIKTFGKGKGEKPLFKLLRKSEDYDEAANALRKFDLKSDDLMAHASLQAAKELLERSVGAIFINKGLFSNYFLKERLTKKMSERGRNLSKEAQDLFSKIDKCVFSDPLQAVSILEALGFNAHKKTSSGYPEYALDFKGEELDVCCIFAPVDSLDFRTGEMAAPSYQAVAKLRDFNWALLSNGPLWRIYCKKSPSESTSFFELNLEGLSDPSDQRLIFLAAIFSALSFVRKGGISDIDLIYEGSIIIGHGLEEDLRSKVFNDQLFLNLVRSTLVFDKRRRYSEADLEQGKKTALKLLYRLLFVLYAEARGLLPMQNENYRAVSLENMRSRLNALEKVHSGTEAWESLQALFRMIHCGNPAAQMPEYDGELFAEDEVDGKKIVNDHLLPAIKDLMLSSGTGIDYLNLGVRQLGSIYEALLEYSVKQAATDLMVYKDSAGKNGLTILDATFASDLQAKPKSFIPAGEIYLTVGGLARKGTGSYYTPDGIVRFLAKEGLKPHFRRREALFRQDMEKLRALKGSDPNLEMKSIDDLLGLEVVDPAMGSGHFLVAAANEITSWAISLLHENPDAPLNTQVEEDRRMVLEEQANRGIMLDADQLTDAVILKRMVMKRCVFGVDINPMAVELAKLSLWLESFTIGTPLTFLDHHMRCGDSLMGLWRNSLQEERQTRLRQWTGELEAAGKALFHSVSQSHDLNLEELRQSREGYERARQMTKPQEELLDLQVASIIDPEAEDASLTRQFRAFHWEYEFPDAFIETEWGFDLVVMNPPWDVVKPEDDDFFSNLSPGFRRIKSKPEKRKVMEKLLLDPAAKAAYLDYRKKIEQRINFYRSSEYSLRGSGDTNLWKLFMERGMRLLAKGGTLSVVVPSGIITDEGGKPLREKLFEGKIRGIFEFENKRGIFPDVHRSYKFALLFWDKDEPVPVFPAAFYLQDVRALEGKAEQEKFLEMPMELVRICAPDSLSIPEVRNQQHLRVFTKLCRAHPLLGDPEKGWHVGLVAELHRTNDSKLFRSDGQGWPLIEGKSFHQFLPDYEKPIFTVDPDQGLKRTARCKFYKDGMNGFLHMMPRLAFRDIASSTNVRSMIACILPPKTLCSNKAPLTIPLENNCVQKGKSYLQFIGYLAGVFDSFVFDFLIRTRVSINLNFFYVYQTPIPANYHNSTAQKIIQLAARLSSPDERFRELAEAMDVPFGPLTMKERLEMTAELNALVARHYGLSREDLAVILESFASFEEDPGLESLEEIKWSDTLMRKFNGEVRRRVMGYFDALEKSPAHGGAE
ncbi:MAG: hypothetical protein A4E48_01693 [Methanosaeta sp. PtaU1.Bin060]|jgi:hypothetical protein|uniref:Eco57I restriction-modification methylase domain-containing protein n=1 Tax=Methanothrix soehngenii TaxID=2223 RepID=UPI0009C4D197|nr:hypothetical protein [Methanothrix soehngenii]OPY50939.1 MAG: hypothetical protein A4E48_01693 [Methanosaeta sp. PtaU1.Bin060]